MNPAAKISPRAMPGLIDSVRPGGPAAPRRRLWTALTAYTGSRLAVAAVKRTKRNNIGSTSATAVFVMPNVDPQITAMKSSPMSAAILLLIETEFAAI